MTKNQEANQKKDIQILLWPDLHPDSRLGEDRRRKPSEGYTYISSVGWIDRRERIRRNDDPNQF